MQPTVYYPTISKPGLYTPLPKHENYSVKSNHVGLTSYTPGSPRANFQLYKIQQRPSGHNISQNNNKRISEHQPKITNLQSSVRQNHTYTQKSTNFQHPRNKYTEMKISYMGPDLRQAAHIKQTKQAINQNFRTPKKIPRASQPNIFNQTDNNQTIKASIQSSQQNLFTKKSFQQNLTQISKQSKLSYISSAKKLDPVQRIRMRKSSFDLTESWLKPMTKKKIQRKWNLNDFDKISQLGSGKYGKVYLVKQKATQFICAIKIIQKQMLKQQQITEQFIRELKIQLFLNHPNIIKMYGYFDDAVNIYIILQVALGGQLFKQVKKNQPMPQTKVAIIIRQVVAAINQLHANNIIHRDIKPENIVLNQNIVKLCDFGWSVYHGQTLRNTFCGTPLYVSPQILRGNNYDDKIDIWSLGIMMYEMLTGENPFKITQEQQLIKIIKDAVTFPTYLTISNEAKDFVMCCLQKNPSDRKNIRQLLNHQFFKKYPEKTPDRKMGV